MSRAADLISRRREASIAFVAIVLFVYFWFTDDTFGTENNLRSSPSSPPSVAILAIAQVMLLVAGEIDLSLGHIYALTPFLMCSAHRVGLAAAAGDRLRPRRGVARRARQRGHHGDDRRPVVHHHARHAVLPPRLHGDDLRRVPEAGAEGSLADWLGGADFSGFLWAVGLTVVLHIVLTNTRWGVYTVATGGNPVGAREAGVLTKRIKVGNFMLAAALAGFTGISEGIRISSFDPLAGGSQLMFYGVAAAVIGGTALAGGSGTIIGAFLGALVLGVLRDGLTIKGISAYTFNMILGAAIIASMILNVAANRLRLRMRRT